VRLPVEASRIAGRRLVVGLRPEHVKAEPGAASFTVQPTLVESLGSEKYVYVSLPAHNRLHASELSDGRRAEIFVARLVEPGDIRTGQQLTLSFDPARLHLFDAETGESL
jgi:multiple sugar transport system ATP-binding protein